MNNFKVQNPVSKFLNGVVEDLINKYNRHCYNKIDEGYGLESILIKTRGVKHYATLQAILKDFSILNTLSKKEFGDFVTEIQEAIELGIYDEFDANGFLFHDYVLESEFSTEEQREKANLACERIDQEFENMRLLAEALSDKVIQTPRVSYY